MQSSGIGPSFVRVLANTAPDVLSELLTVGRVIEADVVSVFKGQAILAMRNGARLEVELQAPLTEGQRVKLQVQGHGEPPAQGAGKGPLILKLISVSEPFVSRPSAEGQSSVGKSQQAAPALEQTVKAPPPESSQAPHHENNTAWLPIPLPNNAQGWAQIHVQGEGARKSNSRTAAATHHVRLWWETPALGSILVTMDATDTGLTALFTVRSTGSRAHIEQSLDELRRRLDVSGFPEARLGTRQSLPGETVEPLRSQDAPRFDRRA